LEDKELKDFENKHKKEIEEANKKFEKESKEMNPFGADDELDDDELDDDEKLLTYGQKIHLAKEPLKGIFGSTITAVFVVAIVIGLVMPVSFFAIDVIDVKTHEDFRLDSRYGPLCNPQLYEDSENYPAQILVKDNSHAYDFGLRNGDIITKINDIQINNIAGLSNWSDKLGVSPGEIVRVSVLHTDGSVEQLEITTIPKLNQNDKAELGASMPNESTCIAYLFVNDDEIVTGSDLALLKSQFQLIIGILIIFAIVIGIGAWKWFPEIRKLRIDVEDWEEEYLDESYSLAFETNKFSERIGGETLFDISQEIFPELRKKSGRLENWAGKISSNNYVFDCFQPTNQEIPELFIAKNFDGDKINFESIKEICEEIKKAKKNNDLRKDFEGLKDMQVFRVICIGENYDEKIINDDNYLDEIKDKLNPGYPIDFIIEKDGKCDVVQFEY
jgi:hypothetical protein